MNKPLVIGLHMTKCAGSSLATAFSQVHPVNSWCICSEFVDNQRKSLTELIERQNLDEIRFIFGHYIHQSLLPIFKSRRIYLFTGVREPASRVKSEYYHICRIKQQVGQPPISAEAFLEIRHNTMCNEVLRAFPAGHSVPGNLADKAARVLELFNLIYSSDNLEDSTQPLRPILQLGKEPFPLVNERRVADAHSGYLAEQAALLEEHIDEAFAYDIELYEKLQPRIGVWRETKMTWADWWDKHPSGGPPWLRPVMHDDVPMDALIAHQAKYMARNFDSAGKRAELEAMIRQKRSVLDRIEAELAQLPSALSH